VITLTQAAIDKIKSLNEGNVLRVSVMGGGCSGLNYKLDFDQSEALPAEDKTFEQGGIVVVTDPKSYLFLKGLTIDFDGSLNGKGFVFNNPVASKSCGCGNSFST
jgi:iron-sulfur cluster assembly protein